MTDKLYVYVLIIDKVARIERRWSFRCELAELGDKFIHRPWDAPASELKQAGIVLGQNYPKPVVALDFGRRRALDAFAALRSE
ncbi:hypothetical protein RO273_007052 [Pseudomonas aeruginosa]|nr:hypothetical protein [Pseudomonas aeruginosa]ELH4137204.1 hypothetical protein [Pseudomonas aeruginosa]